MLKKTHKSSQELSCSRRESVQCSACNSYSMKKMMYVCESGHVICEHCQDSDGSEGRQDSGDFVSEKKHVKHTHKLKKSRPETTLAQIKDLASGDYDKHSKTNAKRRSKSEGKSDNLRKEVHYESRSSSQEKNIPQEEVETIIEYKNVNFHGSKSSSSSSLSCTAKHEIEMIESQENRVCPRPVTCPVQECSKMIALDSVMLHFYFDHSKVSRIILSTTARQIILKPSTLTVKTQCLGIFVIQNKKAGTIQQKVDSGAFLNGAYNDCKSLLLMGARIHTEKLKIIDGKICTSSITLRNVCTQTEIVPKNMTKKKSEAEVKVQHCEYPTPRMSKDNFDDNEVLLLWLCKLDDGTESYSITVLSADKKQGHNYIGEAVHIREEQDSLMMYQRSTCLIVHGAAANRLVDEQSQISVLVNVLE